MDGLVDYSYNNFFKCTKLIKLFIMTSCILGQENLGTRAKPSLLVTRLERVYTIDSLRGEYNCTESVYGAWA